MSRPSFPGVTIARRRNMQANRSKNTKPELLVRRYLHANGFRYRLHRRDLPGSPDITLAKFRSVVEVRGCFWHGHGCKLGKLPSARQDYWHSKIVATKARDEANRAALEAAGWRVIEVWECSLREAPDSKLAEVHRALKARF
ncbi:very short patch repair endonuclease [Sphingomonas lacusdianchii]|uniref:very short patch repair endonuclease n=1 Tax=Sphingomonas lacusdianchii TaxID=2917992 RepID=UPI002412939F|nr:very short patch repair endonuclease [Sphingomonas sp. JXJ CY 53]